MEIVAPTTGSRGRGQQSSPKDTVEAAAKTPDMACLVGETVREREKGRQIEREREL